MFGLLTDAIENTFDIMGELIDGELPSKRQVAKLIDAGVSIYAISEATGFAVEVIEELIDE